MFSISEFLARIDQGGIAKSDYFDVLITRKTAGQNTNASQLLFRTNAVNLPGRVLGIGSENYYGLPFFFPTGSNMGSVGISIYMSEDYREREFFEEWADDMGGNYRKLGESGATPSMFDVGYADDCYGTLLITCYSATNEVKYQIKCLDVLPVHIDDTNLSWESENVVKFNTSFSFRYYVKITDPENITTSTPTTTSNPSENN